VTEDLRQLPVPARLARIALVTQESAFAANTALIFLIFLDPGLC
jgi:hypothetical protein